MTTSNEPDASHGPSSSSGPRSNRPSTTCALSTDAVLDLLQRVAADIITPRFRALRDGEVIEKRPGDLVTVADREAEVAITDELTAAYPGAVVLGEEAYAADPSLLDRYLAAEHAFTVDPVDGTRNFVHGSPDHAVMAAEVVAGEVVRAWIWQPEHGQAWVAERGLGTTCNGNPRRVGLGQPLPAGATSMWALRGKALGDLPPMRLSWACCGIDYPRLIEGAADYVFYNKSHPWDHAPGSLLLTEAGGSIGFTDGTPYSPKRTRPRLIAAVSDEVYAAVRRRTPRGLRS